MPVTVPPPSILHDFVVGGSVIDFVRLLLPALLWDRVDVTSWYRDAATNRAVGGAERSQHRWGLAFDFVGPPDALEAVGRFARLRGLVPVFERSHLHVQAFPAGFLDEFGVEFLDV